MWVAAGHDGAWRDYGLILGLFYLPPLGLEVMEKIARTILL